MVKENLFLLINNLSMLDIELMAKRTVKELLNILINLLTKVSLKKIKNTVLEKWNINLKIFMKETEKRIKKMAMEQ